MLGFGSSTGGSGHAVGTGYIYDEVYIKHKEFWDIYQICKQILVFSLDIYFKTDV